MKLSSKEIVRLLLDREHMKQKELAELLSQRIGKKYTQGSLSQKISRSSISYDEFVVIADILGYSVNVDRKS